MADINSTRAGSRLKTTGARHAAVGSPATRAGLAGTIFDRVSDPQILATRLFSCSVCRRLFRTLHHEDLDRHLLRLQLQAQLVHRSE